MTTKIKLLCLFTTILVFVSCDNNVTNTGPKEENPPAGDTTPPEVSNVSPDDGADSLSVDVNLNAEFNEQVDESNTSFTLKDSSGSEVQGVVEFDGKTVTFTPDNSLQYSIEYTPSIKATDTSGNEMEDPHSWSFTTRTEPDTSPPELTNVSPDSSASGVSIDTSIEATFHEQISSSSLSFSVKDESDNSVDGSVSTEGKTVVFKPDTVLRYSTEYTSFVKASDMSGNEMNSSSSWTFTTESNPDKQPPEVVSTTPANNEQNVSGLDITIKMSETINESSVNSDNIWVKLIGTEKINIDYSVVDKNTITVKPSDPYSPLVGPARKYRVHIEGVKDKAGNIMTASYEWSFSTTPWRLGENYLTSGQFTGIKATDNSVYFVGMFEKEENFKTFFVGKYNKKGLIEWITKLPGKTDDAFPSQHVTVNTEMNELYFFTEKGKQPYFNRVDAQSGELLHEKRITDSDFELLRRGPIIFDNQNNLYFVRQQSTQSGRLSVNELLKTDRDGGVIDKLNFGSFRCNDIATNGTVIFTGFCDYNGDDTSAKIDVQSMEFDKLLILQDGEKGPHGGSVEMIRDGDKVYYVGEYNDKPIALIQSVNSSSDEKITFGTIYNAVRNFVVGKSRSMYVGLTGQQSSSIAKVSDSGKEWQTDLPEINAQSLTVSESLERVFALKLFGGIIYNFNSITGEE